MSKNYIQSINRKNAFLALVKAGLWEQDVELRKYGDTNYSKILQLAEEQSVVGLVAAGWEQVKDVKILKEWALQFAGRTLQLEQQNKAMNSFVAKLIESLRRSDVYSLLVKGQGVAQCYEKPLWRACGDIDLLLSNDNYKKAKGFLIPLSDEVPNEDARTKHLAMVIKGFDVELHGRMPFSLSKRVDRELDNVQDDLFCKGNVRSWNCNDTLVVLPSPDNDVILVFTHFLQHFFIEGVGLRQICDWCRLLWTFRDSLDKVLLEKRIRKMGLMTEWKAFASLAVDTLGMPVEAMPFYDVRFRRKGERVLTFVMEAGNFGHNKDLSYRKRYRGWTYKMVSLFRRIVDFAKFVPIFPLDAPRFFLTYVTNKVR